MKRTVLCITFTLVLVLMCRSVFAMPANPAVSQDITQLLISMRGPTIDAVQSVKEESARVSLEDGYLRILGAPANHHFPVSKAVAGNPTVTAKNFIAERSAAFGVKSKAVDFAPKKSKKRDGRSYERFQQTYSQIPVFGAEVVIQLNVSGGVEYVVSDIMRETIALDDGKVSTVPMISAADAKFLAIELMAEKHPGLQLDSSDAQLMIYQPAVVGNSGSTRLVWQTVVVSVSVPTVNEFILIDAHTGEVALHYTQIMDAMNRKIYDSNNTSADPGTLSRSEGGPATGIADVDNCYDFLGDIYDFYFNEHGRNSINNAGMTLSATVRICPYSDECPYENAFWNGSRMYFGEGFVVDDVTAHELTHGVTQYESNLIYQNESGAINESFSDMWGEWIDLTNGAGNDAPSVRWLMGEDIPGIGAIRNMANPPAFGDPDRKNSPLWYTGTGDNGGVHTNSGVGNKLCYLLTDGAAFNGQTVTGMGIPAVADLFYEVQTNLLTSGSDYADLHASLTQAAINLGWSVAKRNNLENACLATELSAADPPVAQDGSAGTQINTSVPITLVATDDGLPDPPGALTYIITSLPSNGVLSDPGNGVISSVPYSLLGYGDQVVYTPDTSFTGSDSFKFKANDGGTAPYGGDSNLATVTVNISTEQLIYMANMDTDPGWTLDSLWQWGTPTGSGGQYHGNPDPVAGYTGDNVVGYNLLGDYENSITSTRWAKTPAINCTSRTDVTLTFYRWLNVEQPLYDHAYIQVSNNGSSWSTIWENPSGITITDSSWTLQTFDISAIADDQPTVYIRWGMGPTDSSWQYSGWNIDDVKIAGEGSLLPRPPAAQDRSAGTQINTSVPITLVATDDGLPNPPGALTYIITSLPSNGVLSDPGNGVISSVPYSLLGYGDQVVYTPDTSFTGSDSFKFKANDGGTAPDGGDSNPASVTVTVINSTVIFSEDFESGLGGFVIDNSFGNGNGLWHLSTVCNTALPGHTKPTALFYGLDGSCTYNNGLLTNQGVVTSPSISLAGFPTGPIELRLNYFLKTEGSPANYDRVSIEISENGGPFILISHNDPIPGTVTLIDPSTTWLETVIDLSAFAGSSIQLRFGFNSVDATLNDYEGFYVDDVNITAGIVSNPPPGQAASPEPANAAINVSLTNNLSWTAGSGATSHDVYFGTTSPPTFRGNQTGTTYDTGRMTPHTTYYWRIDEKNAYGTTTGMVWSFTTAVSEVWQSESVNWRVDYGNNWNKTGTATKPGATAIRLHFSTIDVESGWDHLYSNAGDNWSGTYTDVTSGENSGGSITLTLTSDTSVTKYFIIDRVDYQGTSAGPATASGGLFWDNGSGDITYDFDGLLYIWDISGSYSGPIDVQGITLNLDYVISQDTSGKITGTGTADAIYGSADIDIPFDVKGSVGQKNGNACVNLSFKGNGPADVEGETVKFTFSEQLRGGIIDPCSNEISGEAKVRLSARGVSARETILFTEPLPDDMDGSATLSISCAPSGKRLLGTGELTLSNDETYNFGVKGTYNVRKDESSLTLKGDARGNSLKMKIDGSDGRIKSLNGKVLGQVLEATDIMPMP